MRVAVARVAGVAAAVEMGEEMKVEGLTEGETVVEVRETVVEVRVAAERVY